MDLETLLTAVYCQTDDFLAGRKLRQRGPHPTLHDSEVPTMEIAGEFLGIDTDAGLSRYFRRHHAALLPRLQTVHRTSFARATFCRRLREVAAYGHAPVARQTFFGMRAHLRISWPGVISAFDLAPANLADPTMAPEILAGSRGWALGDRFYWSPRLRQELKESALCLLAPFSSRTYEKEPWPFWLLLKRRRIETVIAQLVERFHLGRVWARDPWHLCSRMLRKLLGHTVAVLLCQRKGLPPLSFDAPLES
jgi:hypothetical protein